MSDPHWPRAGEWIAGGVAPDATRVLALLGAPLHIASISPSQADLAPAAVRTALSRFSLADIEGGADLSAIGVRDEGDLPLAPSFPETALKPLSEKVRSLRDGSDVVLILGGDNSVTRPAVHGTGSLDSVGLITLDAHFDLRELDSGLTNGNPIRALLEDGLPGPHVAQIGIQSFANSPAHARVAAEAGINVVTREEVEKRGIEEVMRSTLDMLASKTDAIYVDFDIDVLDRAFAPATPGSRPGGLAPTELFTAARICGAHRSVVAADIVEVSPPEDINGTTVMAAAKVLLSLAAGLALRGDR